MKKRCLSLFVVCSIFFVGSADALQFGTVGNDWGYQNKADTTQEFFGTLKVLHVFPDVFLGAHSYYLTINDKDIVAVEQGVGVFTRKFAVATVNLPNGSYNVKLRTKPFFRNVMTEFNVVIKAGKTISVLVKKDKAELAFVNFESLYSDVEFYNSDDFYDENLKLLIAEKFLVAEDVYRTELDTKDKLIKADEESKAASRSYYERKFNSDLEVDKRAREYESNRRLEEKAAVKKESDRALLQQKKLQAEDAKVDDQACRSYGAVQGTQAYVLCRATFATKRAEAKDRAEVNNSLSEKFDSYMEQQERLRKQEREAQDAKADMLQRSADAERKRRDQRQRLDDAERLLDRAARMGQQETITCTSTFGNTVNCRK